jgi:ribosomal protein S18 acetylase RimI-like enzyme/predicted nucleic acid-binding protein
MDIRDVVGDDTLIEQVINLGDQNSRFLGHFPAQAFKREAAFRRIFAAVDETDKIAGYVLYRTSRGRAVVQHLCVSAASRRLGVGRMLIDELKRRTKHFPYICCHVAAEFTDARQAWERFGFVYQGEKPGRGLSQRPLLRMVFDHGHETLFSTAERDLAETTLVIALDMNVAVAMRTADDDDVEISALRSDWLTEEVSYWVAAECRTEAARNRDASIRQSTLVHLRSFSELTRDQEREEAVLPELRALLGDPRRVQDASDLRQLAQAIAGNADVFLTRDEGILKLAADLRRFQIEVLRPTDLVVKLDELVRSDEYAPARLHGSRLERQRVTHDRIDPMISTFLNSAMGEKKHELDSRIRTTLASPQDGEVITVLGESGVVHAIMAMSWVHPSVGDIRVLRVLRGRLARTLTRHLLAHAVRAFAIRGRSMAILTDNRTLRATEDEARHLGFVSVGRSMLKWSTSGATSRAAASAEVRRLSKGLAPEEALKDWADRLLRATPSPFADFEIENFMWPGVLLDSTLPSYIVPIKPTFARQLFDAKLNDDRLFGGDPELILTCENVYYRSARVPVVTAPGRVLWYVSADRDGAIQQLRGMSLVLDVQSGPASRMFKQYEKLGVYQWSDIRRMTGNNEQKEILAIHFGPTEIFTHPVPRADLDRVIIKHTGRSKPPLSMPLEISPHCFRELIEISYGR